MFLTLHCIAILTHAICAVYAFCAEAAYTATFHVQLHRADFRNRSPEAPYFLPIDSVAFQVPSVILIHGCVAVITALFHMLVYFPIHYLYPHTVWVKNQCLAVRWIEYSITCTLMTIASTLSSGTTDFNLVLTILFAGFPLQFMGCCIEQFKSLRLTWPFLAAGVALNLGTSWNVVWGNLSGEGDPQMWIETIAYAFYYSLFAINCIFDAVYRDGCFVQTDWYYNLLSLTSKVSLFWLQVGQVERAVDGGVWPDVQVYAFGMFLPLVVLAIGGALRPSCGALPECDTDSEGKYSLLHKLASFRLYHLCCVHQPSVPERQQAARAPRSSAGRSRSLGWIGAAS